MTDIFVIGIKYILKNAKERKLEKLVVANNCPQSLVDKVNAAAKKELKIERFDGDQRKLGTSIGKPFAVALIGYLKK